MSSYDDQAADLFRRFHGYLPSKPDDLVIIRDPARTCLYVGQVEALMYVTEEHTKPFFHRFGVSSRPLLYVTSDGKEIRIVKGRFEFTERGFIG